MLIQVGLEIAFDSPEPAPMLLMLQLHHTRDATVRVPERLEVEPAAPIAKYLDIYGNRCARVVAPRGRVTFRNRAIVEDSGLPDLQAPDAMQHPVEDLPDDTLLYLLASRYCEVDSQLKDLAWTLFGQAPPGWGRVQAICDFVHRHIRFDYMQARADRTALDVYRERRGVCRDFMHLAITFCRNCNIPARYCTGYLGDIGVTPSADPMDFSAWFEVFVGGQWYVFDARNNVPRIGRVLMARGRDAADVALTTTFGVNTLRSFEIETIELPGELPGEASSDALGTRVQQITPGTSVAGRVTGLPRGGGGGG